MRWVKTTICDTQTSLAGEIPNRLHGAFISSEETERLVEFIKDQGLEMMALEGISQGCIDGVCLNSSGLDENGITDRADLQDEINSGWGVDQQLEVFDKGGLETLKLGMNPEGAGP